MDLSDVDSGSFYVCFMLRFTVEMCMLIRGRTASTRKDNEFNTCAALRTYCAAHLAFWAFRVSNIRHADLFRIFRDVRFLWTDTAIIIIIIIIIIIYHLYAGYLQLYG
jgi:hypothetical protein